MSKADGKGGKTAAEREAEAREEKLAQVQEQISSGSLVIRTMTPAERAKWAKRKAVRAAQPPTDRHSQAAAKRRRTRPAPS